MLNKIKDIVKPTEVSLEQLKLENGTVLEAEKFEKGNEVFILTDDTKVALPVGEYQLESGDMLNVQEEGIISDLGYEKKEEEDMEDAEEKREDKGEADVEDWAGMEKRIKNLEDAVADLKADKEDKNEEVKEEKQETEDLSAVPQEVADALSEPAAKAIKHSPEVKETKKPMLYGQNRPMNTMDRVLQMMSNRKK